MKLNTDFPWLCVKDDERFNGVVWRLVGEVIIEDQEDGSGLLNFDLEINDSTNPIKDVKAFHQYTGDFISKAIQKGLEIEKT